MTAYTDKNKDGMSIENVTPEFAAKIVKHFVLPMFSTDHKRAERKAKHSPKSVFGELNLT
jgi:hypothetical protein